MEAANYNFNAETTGNDIADNTANNELNTKYENVKKAIDNLDNDSIKEMKLWLFKESCRLENQESALEERYNQLEIQEREFSEKHRKEYAKLEHDRKKLNEDKAFFEQKLDILKNGYDELQADKKKVEQEWEKIRLEKMYMEEDMYSSGKLFFKGVNSVLALKKRYKDLLKIYHPDNVGGDHEMVTIITAEYNQLLRQFEVSKKA